MELTRSGLSILLESNLKNCKPHSFFFYITKVIHLDERKFLFNRMQMPLEVLKALAETLPLLTNLRFVFLEFNK